MPIPISELLVKEKTGPSRVTKTHPLSHNPHKGKHGNVKRAARRAWMRALYAQMKSRWEYWQVHNPLFCRGVLNYDHLEMDQKDMKSRRWRRNHYGTS